ncbi:MAG: hypothetical protein L6V89_07765 [Oscillospiraceae bacterium]|nr:MAG: hypothetical protein L6V89_07765 [Oscillospiraceae bacterium]
MRRGESPFSPFISDCSSTGGMPSAQRRAIRAVLSGAVVPLTIRARQSESSLSARRTASVSSSLVVKRKRRTSALSL